MADNDEIIELTPPPAPSAKPVARKAPIKKKVAPKPVVAPKAPKEPKSKVVPGNSPTTPSSTFVERLRKMHPYYTETEGDFGEFSLQEERDMNVVLDAINKAIVDNGGAEADPQLVKDLHKDPTDAVKKYHPEFPIERVPNTVMLMNNKVIRDHLWVIGKLGRKYGNNGGSFDTNDAEVVAAEAIVELFNKLNPFLVNAKRKAKGNPEIDPMAFNFPAYMIAENAVIKGMKTDNERNSSTFTYSYRDVDDAGNEETVSKNYNVWDIKEKLEFIRALTGKRLVPGMPGAADIFNNFFSKIDPKTGKQILVQDDFFDVYEKNLSSARSMNNPVDIDKPVMGKGESEMSLGDVVGDTSEDPGTILTMLSKDSEVFYKAMYHYLDPPEINFLMLYLTKLKTWAAETYQGSPAYDEVAKFAQRELKLDKSRTKTKATDKGKLLQNQNVISSIMNELGLGTGKNTVNVSYVLLLVIHKLAKAIILEYAATPNRSLADVVNATGAPEDFIIRMWERFYKRNQYSEKNIVDLGKADFLEKVKNMTGDVDDAEVPTEII